MSINPTWTGTLHTCTVWAPTDSNLQLWHAFDNDGRALCNRRIRAHNHREEGKTWFRNAATVDAMPASHMHDRCREKAHEVAETVRAAAEQEWREQEQYANAAELFAALHPAAEELTRGLQGNVLDTAREGGPLFTSGEVWGQIGAEPGQRLAWNADDDPEEWATADGFNTVWVHINRLAAAGKLDLARWDALVTEARDVLATASVRPAPVVLDKRPSSWQVLWHTESPLTGEQWADLPVHSVVRTAQLRAGHDWDTTDQRLAARGLSRYGFPSAVSAGHALALAQERWREDGPHSAWFAFLDGASEEIESLRAKYNPTPEQERRAFAWAMSTLANPSPELTLADLHAIASGQPPADQG
ncbi:hypothetical protein [Streptomyces chrestomyceticus]|uniref:hypothetical protein n=1 Tax=Streptomyces chrestomyceticus TaxID=68185 RepID=UPI0033E85B92